MAQWLPKKESHKIKSATFAIASINLNVVSINVADHMNTTIAG